MKKRYVLDSYAMIAFFEDEPGAEKVENILIDITSKRASGWISVINWGELYYSTYRERGMENAEDVILQLSKYPITIVEADKTLTKVASKYKGKHKVAFADCFAAALAKQLHAVVVTGDPEFKCFEKEIEILWI